MRSTAAIGLVTVTLAALASSGCGNAVSRSATEQLLTSDAVDQTVSTIDFSGLADSTVYFDTAYIENVKGVGFVNADYIVSSLRQQMVAARCLLKEKKDDAEFIVEARVGALGTDGHELTYGMPANNVLNTAASLVPGAPPLPSLPELSIAKRNDQLGAAKIGVFAYHRESGEPVWQSGIRQSRSTAKDFWLFGAGPFQSGSIHQGHTRFAGQRLPWQKSAAEAAAADAPDVNYMKEAHFPMAPPFVVDDAVPAPLDATSRLSSDPSVERPADIESAIDWHFRLGWERDKNEETPAKSKSAPEASSSEKTESAPTEPPADEKKAS